VEYYEKQYRWLSMINTLKGYINSLYLIFSKKVFILKSDCVNIFSILWKIITKVMKGMGIWD